MHERRVHPSTEFLEPFLRLTSAEFWNTISEDLKDRIRQSRAHLSRYPYRILANSIVLWAYRNGPVEDLHAGRSRAHSLEHRRATGEQCRDLMRFTSQRLSAALGTLRLWEEDHSDPVPWPTNLAGIHISPVLTPPSWSLSEFSSSVTLSAE